MAVSFSEGGDMRSRAGRLLGIGMVGMLVSVGSAAGQERFEVGMDGVISYTMTQRVERMLPLILGEALVRCPKIKVVHLAIARVV